MFLAVRMIALTLFKGKKAQKSLNCSAVIYSSVEKDKFPSIWIQCALMDCVLWVCIFATLMIYFKTCVTLPLASFRQNFIFQFEQKSETESESFQNQPAIFSAQIPAIEFIDSKHHFYIYFSPVIYVLQCHTAHRNFISVSFSCLFCFIFFYLTKKKKNGCFA